MTMMRDTEGDALPNNGPDDEHDNCWDINLWGDGELSLAIPMFFDTGDGGEYNGAGIVTVGLHDLLQETWTIATGWIAAKGCALLRRCFVSSRKNTKRLP